MVGLYIVAGIIASVLGLFFWTYLHELSHLLMYKRFGKVLQSVIVPYPHFHEGVFYFGRTSVKVGELYTKKEMVIISFAPRIVDLIGLVLLGLFMLFFENKSALEFSVLMFLFCPAIDLFVGSLGSGEGADIRRYSRNKTELWCFKILQLSIVATCVIFSVRWLIR